MNLRPLHDRLVVQRLEDPPAAAGPIIIPDSAKEKPQRGTVIAAGDGKLTESGVRVPLDIKAGDHVLFGKYAGQEIKLGGVDYLILREDEVLGAIDNVSNHAANGVL
jgi:chaperonin GroES